RRSWYLLAERRTMGAVPPLIILMHAPVLGPASWRPIAGELSGAGLAAVVPSLAGFAAGGPPYARRLVATAAGQVLAGAARPAADGPGAHEPAADESAANDAAANDAAVLVTHSGAGVFAAQLTLLVNSVGSLVCRGVARPFWILWSG